MVLVAMGVVHVRDPGKGRDVVAFREQHTHYTGSMRAHADPFSSPNLQISSPHDLPLGVTEPHNLRESLVPAVQVSQHPLRSPHLIAHESQVLACTTFGDGFAGNAINLFKMGDLVVI